MKVYIDAEFRCHTINPYGEFREVETEFFNGKCRGVIEGYRYIPSGESWTRSDGVVFEGEMYSPFTPYRELDAAQREYEREKLAEYEALIDELYAEVAG